MFDIYEDLPSLMNEYRLDVVAEAIASVTFDRCIVMDADGYIL